MGFVDPERFKRFQQFLSSRMVVFADAAQRGFAAKGPGVVIYNAPDDRFDPATREVRLQYRSKADIDAVHAQTRDELLQGVLDLYQPPNEAVFLAIYPDNTYDVSRVVLRRPEGQGGPPAEQA